MTGPRFTYFLTCVTYQRRSVFQTRESAKIAYETVLHYATEGRYQLHGFVIMPDHIHALLTPAPALALERCVQCIKGGISFRLQKQIPSSVWQREYYDHRIRDDAEFAIFMTYIDRNPAKRGLTEWPWVWTAS
jgi:putative transposase